MQRALVVAIFGAACLLGDRVVSPVGALTPRAAEIRGVWVVRTSLTSRDDITRVVDTARRGGFNTLFVQVRGRGDAFYKSALEPRSVDLAGQPATFDPLAVTLDLGHRAGLRVHAWIVVNLVSSSVALPRAPGHVVNKHPEWLMVPQPLAKSLHSVAPSARAYLARLADWTREMSDHVEGLYLSPVSPGARQYTVDVVTEIAANYAVDGVHFDYVRFPSEAFDYSAVSLLEFRNAQAASTPAPDRQRLDGLARTNPLAWSETFPQAWEDFRRDRLTRLVRALTSAVRSARPQASISAAVVPRAEEAKTRRLQDWPRWIAAGDLDAVCPMAYVSDDGEFRALVTNAREIVGRVPVWAGIGAFRLPPAGVAAQIRSARGAGAAGVVIFSSESFTGPAGADYLGEVRAAFGGRTP